VEIVFHVKKTLPTQNAEAARKVPEASAVWQTNRCILAPPADILSLDLTLENLISGRISVRIDVHAHYFPLEYLDRLDRYGGSHVTGLIRKMQLDAADFSGLQDHLRNMDRSKVDLQVLSVSGQLPYFAKESEALDAARLANDIYARIVREYPKRFAAFACTPLPHVQASIEETLHSSDLRRSGIAADRDHQGGLAGRRAAGRHGLPAAVHAS
jgi:predicted TIM-barrel fold metal-dependent hydrolase